jgi:peptidoglycan L-alanyl-D-glutamate endopeptidase CwlK
MAYFSDASLQKLATCHQDLQDLFKTVILHYDCTILEGHRSEADQDQLFEQGLSKVEWPDSKHNKIPSHAVDVAPYPIDWDDTKRFYHFVGFVKGVAASMNIKLRCGADWDGDNDLKDQSFNDLVHFELIK